LDWRRGQARLQDFAVRRSKSHKERAHILNAILDVCSKWGTKHEMWGRASLAPPLATALVQGRVK